MQAKTEELIKKQVLLIPNKISEFIKSETWKAELVAISLDHGLESSLSNKLKREVLFVLIGFIHPDDFRDEIRKTLHLDKAILSRLVPEIEDRIFAPIKGDLIAFNTDQKEAAKRAVEQEEGHDLEVVPVQGNIPEQTEKVKAPEKIPENLPTGSGVPETYTRQEAFIPELTPKQAPAPEKLEPPHPFEQKMKQVLGANTAPQSDFKIETPQTPKAPDPYREAI